MVTPRNSAEQPAPEPARRAAHSRLPALGLAMVMGWGGLPLLAFTAHWFDTVVVGRAGGQSLVMPNALAPAALFLMLILVAAVNPLLRRASARLALGRRELVLVLGLWLIGGAVASRSHAVPAVVTAGLVNSPAAQRPMFERAGLRTYFNPRLYLPREAARDFYYGLSPDGTSRVRAWPFGVPTSNSAVPVVPWRVWIGPLSYWLAFIATTVLFAASLVRMMHRQWSRHELLAYPLATVGEALVRIRAGGLWPEMFYSRAFWAGFAIPAVIFTLNGLHAYFPLVVDVPLAYDHHDLLKEFPFLAKYCGREAYALFRGMIYPPMVSIAALLPTELSLTCWLGWILMVLGSGLYFKLTGQVIGSAETTSIQHGMYVAMALAILLIGRREYGNILRCALCLRRAGDETLRRAARCCRLFLLAALGLWYLFTIAGLDGFMAAAMVLSLGLVVLLIARLTAETGIPWLVNFSGAAVGLPLKLLGAAAVGPQSLAALAGLSLAMDAYTGATISAQETTVSKLREGQEEGGGAAIFNVLLTVGVAVAVGSAVFFTLRDDYSFGAQREGMHFALVSRMEEAANQINRLQVENRLDQVATARGLGKLRHLAFDGTHLQFFLLGAVMTVGCALMRLRFAAWPFHPLPLLFINTWAMSRLYLSILLGWLIKTVILRVWGGKTFVRLKPAFLGVIAGQVAMFGVWIIVHAIYYAVTGSEPPWFFLGF